MPFTISSWLWQHYPTTSSFHAPLVFHPLQIHTSISLAASRWIANPGCVCRTNSVTSNTWDQNPNSLCDIRLQPRPSSHCICGLPQNLHHPLYAPAVSELPSGTILSPSNHPQLCHLLGALTSTFGNFGISRSTTSFSSFICCMMMSSSTTSSFIFLILVS